MRRLAGLFTGMAILSSWFPAGPALSTQIFETDTHRFEAVAPDVYFVTGTGKLFVQSNSLVVVSESDVIVVDSHVTTDAARALVSSIQELTAKPITTLVNTHYHFDHAHGNEAFASPIAIVGHEYTRHKLTGDVMNEPTFVNFAGGVDDVITKLGASLKDETDPKKKAALEAELRVQEAHRIALGETTPIPPNMSIRDKLTLYRGERSIELHFLGRGHTGGDVVVFLPSEKLVFTGDLLLPFPSYMGDGFPIEWIETLDRLKELDFELILPGHGPPFRDREVIDRFQRVLRAVSEHGRKTREAGLSPEQAADALDSASIYAEYEEDPLSDMPPDLVRFVTVEPLRRIYEELKAAE